jgi:hypothetical protein
MSKAAGASRATTVAATAAGVGQAAGGTARGVNVALSASGATNKTGSALLYIGVLRQAAGLATAPQYRLVFPTSEQVFTDIVPISRYGIDNAKTVILNDGTVSVEDYPDTLTLTQADAYYVGGRDYVLSESEAQALIDAGRPDLVELL